LIETLRIENVAIVERAELEFGPGLNVLTGETGAGKSMVLCALELLAGGRASPELLREGCESATVEAVFRSEALPELEAELAARGLAVEGHELVVSRTVSRSGRGRARVGGSLVPVGTLAELFQGRIEISSQHDSQALLRPEVHGGLLDRAGGLLPLREAVAQGSQALRALDAELARLRDAAREREQRRDFLSWQAAEIDEARLRPGEAAELRAERGRLVHAERLREEGAAALALLCGDELADGGPAGAERLAEAARQLAGLARLDPALVPAAERLRALAGEVREVALDLERHLDGIEADPRRLAALEERLHRIEQLQRKYGENEEAVLRFRAEAERELAALAGAGEREAELAAERAERTAQLAAAAERLSQGRRRAAARLGRAVEAALHELGMPGARFGVALDPLAPPPDAPCGPGGHEAPEFRFAANRGEAPRALRKVASGGELSRTFLALKGALREHAAGMVVVFDEVDAGIGGGAADRVGRALAELAAQHQVLCITHLPQIAAFANAHFRVEKAEAAGRTRARVTRVEGQERVAEIARMAGGERVGAATLRHAQELLAARSRGG
jgi:DNA repair protein RecN (Recombination protein N)